VAAQRYASIVDVHVILRRGGRVLLLRRAGETYASGQLCLPSGHMEQGESIVQAAVRETYEGTSAPLGRHRLMGHPGQARQRVRHRGARRGPGAGARPPGRDRGADRVHRGQRRIRTGLPQARLRPQRPARRAPQRCRPRHRIPAPPRPLRLGKPCPARPDHRHRPRAVPAYARPARLRGPGMRRTPATGQRQLTRQCTAPPAEETA
jgi:hypothetical protein